MTIVGAPASPEYLKFMHRQTDEAPALLEEMLVHATNFFRDPQVFLALERYVVPHLFREGAKDAMRVWIAGSATGCSDSFLARRAGIACVASFERCCCFPATTS